MLLLILNYKREFSKVQDIKFYKNNMIIMFHYVTSVDVVIPYKKVLNYICTFPLRNLRASTTFVSKLTELKIGKLCQ